MYLTKLATMNQKEKDNRILEFENWKTQINAITSKLQIIVTEDSSENLNFTPQSLKTLEKFLILKYDNPMMAYEFDNQVLIEGASTYIGEVYRRNSKAKLDWGVDLDSEPQEELYEFRYYIKSSGKYIGFNPFSKIPFLLNKRTGNILYSHYIHNENIFTIESKTEQNSSIYKGYDYGHFLIPITRGYSEESLLNKIVGYLNSKSLNYEINSNTIDIKYENDFRIHIEIDKRKEIITEIIDQLKANDVNFQQQKPVGIEIWSDKDVMGNFLNEILFLIEHINNKEEYAVIKANE